MSVVEQFAQLFAGRTDAYGSDGGMACRLSHGDAWWAPEDEGLWECHLNGKRPIGVYPMRPYSDGTHYVKWGCVDFDIQSDNHPTYDYETEAEAHIAALNLQAVLSALGVTAWIERTKSYGRHLWVFADCWVPAKDMRRCLLTACGVAEVSVREVNPKSEELRAGQLGNYVRTCYPGGLVEWSGGEMDSRESGMAGGRAGGRGLLVPPQGQGPQTAADRACVADDGSRHSGAGQGDRWLRRSGELRSAQCAICGARWTGREGHVSLASASGGRRGGVDVRAVSVDGRTSSSEDPGVPDRVVLNNEADPICLACFVARAGESRVAPATIKRIAAHYNPPTPRPTINRAPERQTEVSTDLVGRMLPHTRAQYDEDMPADRSAALVRLAGLLSQQTKFPFTPEEVLELLYDADDRWQKYVNRLDRDERLAEIAGKAFA